MMSMQMSSTNQSSFPEDGGEKISKNWHDIALENTFKLGMYFRVGHVVMDLVIY